MIRSAVINARYAVTLPGLLAVVLVGGYGFAGMARTWSGHEPRGRPPHQALARPSDPLRSASPPLTPGDDETIFAGMASGGGVYKTTDGGVTWEAVNESLPE